MLSYLLIVYKTSSVISLGCEVEKRTRRSGLISATISSRLAKLTLITSSDSWFSPPLHLYESTFCPNKVTSRYPRLNKSVHSLMMEKGSRLRSRPRVNGTTQKEHILSHPRIIDTKAFIPLLFKRTGLIS